jgi:hypothetical protein
MRIPREKTKYTCGAFAGWVQPRPADAQVDRFLDPDGGIFTSILRRLLFFAWKWMVVSMIFVEMKSETGEKFVGAQITVE